MDFIFFTTGDCLLLSLKAERDLVLLDLAKDLECDFSVCVTDIERERLFCEADLHVDCFLFMNRECKCSCLLFTSEMGSVFVRTDFGW